MDEALSLSAAKAVLSDQIAWLDKARTDHRRGDALTSTLYSIATVLAVVIDDIEAKEIALLESRRST